MARNTAVSDLSAWAKSLHFSGFTLLMVLLVIAGVLIVSPGVTTLVAQRKEIAELEESVRLHRETVEDIETERTLWKDPAYIRAEARDRLFYVMPGETQLSVIDDIVVAEQQSEPASAELRNTEHDWMRTLASSVLQAGTTAATPDELAGTLTPQEEPAPEDTPDADGEPQKDNE